MAGEAGDESTVRRASPWPVFIAFGFVIGEVGVFLGVVPLAVGGVLLFGGSCAGIIDEAGYGSSPWRTLGYVGLVFVALGSLLWGAYTPAITVHSLLRSPATNLVARRGVAVLGAGLVLGVVAVVGRVRSGRPTD